MITAIIGRNASGKTQWVEQFRRQTASDTLRYVAFRDTYGTTVDSQYYLQLRWNQHDIDAEMPTVRDKLFLYLPPDGTVSPSSHLAELLRLFHLEDALDKYIITLSSGELRKFQLVKTLMSHPKILILDNPFIGLDAETRQQLRDLLPVIAREQHIDLYLVLAKTDDLPEYVDRTLPQPLPVREGGNMSNPTNLPLSVIPPLPHREGTEEGLSSPVIRMRNVSIRYGERTILKDLNWVVKRGEKWALSGENGAGKSTLLSLVCADNPQSYACNITLFGHKRGTGESIWDIKKYIGYVSPEMHRAYLKDVPAIEIVASGMSDFSSLYRKPKAEDLPTCDFWMDIFGIKHLKDTTFLKLSSGEQRLVLLARAFVRDPELLILDEPLHGLDMRNRRLVKEIINEFCKRSDKTMIMVTHYKSEYPECITNEIFLRKNR